MPSITHEGLLQPFAHRPALAAELLADPLGIKLPSWQHARLGSSDLTELVPTEYRADTVIVLSDAGRPVLTVVLEVQLRVDRRKRFSWPVYLANLRARLGCPTVLLVVSPNPVTAAWCADPIELGHPDWVLTPLVLGPDRMPVVTDPVQARRSPELAVLSALAHGGRHPQRQRVLTAFLEALRWVERDQAQIYHDVVSAVLPRAARAYLEGLMSTKTYQWQSDFALRHIAQGEAQGEAKAVLTVLASRGVDVPDDTRQQIASCTDHDQLDRWIRRAATADSIDDLFTG